MTAKKILHLGDSYTVGTGLADPKEAFPFQLRLGEPTLYAVDGHATEDLLASLDANPPAMDYDAVTLLIGVNDVYRGYPLKQYQQGFKKLLEQAIDYAGGKAGRVIVLSIPAWDASPKVADGSGLKARAEKYEQVRAQVAANPAYNMRHGVAATIDTFNTAAREQAETAGATFIDLTDLTRCDGDPALFARDGIHYSGKMYARWAERLLPVLQQKLRE